MLDDLHKIVLQLYVNCVISRVLEFRELSCLIAFSEKDTLLESHEDHYYSSLLDSLVSGLSSEKERSYYC